MGKHTDSFAEETNHANRNRVAEFETFNPSATDDVTISLPNGGRRKLELLKPVLVAMAQDATSRPHYDDNSTTQDVDAIFDEALCDVAALALKTAGLEDCKIDLYKLRSLLLKTARDLDSYEELADYISKYSPNELQQFGLENRGQSTYRKAAKTLKTTGKHQALIDATFIAVHELFLTGVAIPDAVLDRYNLSYSAGPTAADFNDGSRQLALYTLIDTLLDIIVERLNRYLGTGSSCDLRSFIGVFAHSAYTGESIEAYEGTAQHAFELDSAPKGSTIRHWIDDLTIWDVDELFDEIFQALLNYVIGAGVVSDPATVSYDLTDIQSLDIREDHMRFTTEDGRWQFAALSFTDPDLEFAFGLRLLKSEAQRAAILKKLLRNLTAMVDVQLFLADRGFDGRDDIEACRAFVPDSWVICAQDYSDTSGQADDYARLRAKLEPGGVAVVKSAGYENLHPPVKLLGYSGAKESADTIDPVRGFYSGISLADDNEKRKQQITDINFVYNQRAKIESMFQRAKNTFDVGSDTDKPPRKTFYFNMSLLFYNLYEIVNTVPAPNNGLELDITQKELLETTRILAFGGTTRPDALTYVIDDQ